MIDDIKIWEDFGNGIIERAAEDYREVCRSLNRNPFNPEQQQEKLELEEFFSSDWYLQLTDADGSFILWMLREELKEEGVELW